MDTAGERGAIAPAPLVRLAFVELVNFRRLGAVRLEFGSSGAPPADPKARTAHDTTVVVGANDSGKTALLAGVRRFLGAGGARTGKASGGAGSFELTDIPADHWVTLNALGREFEAGPQAAPMAPEDPGYGDWLRRYRDAQRERLHACMPQLDVWLEVRPGMEQLVGHLIPHLGWEGGLVGLRLRLEPGGEAGGEAGAVRGDLLDDLIKAYRSARDLASDGQGWPADLCDYLRLRPEGLGRVQAWRLDPAQLTCPAAPGQAPPRQALVPAARLSGEPLARLVRIDFIAAQRLLGSKERGEREFAQRGQLTLRVHAFVAALLEASPNPEREAARRQVAMKVEKAARDAATQLDHALQAILRPQLKRLGNLGYPNLSELKEIVLRSSVKASDALQHAAAVQYRSAEGSEEPMLPEHSIGLGYQNLLSMAFQLMEMQVGRTRGDDGHRPAPVHLVLLEEPEAHLHVQVQRLFIEQAHGMVHPGDAPDLSTQLLISTHSSHLAHSVSFRQLRYLRRLNKAPGQALPTSSLVGLGDTFGGSESVEDRTRATEPELPPVGDTFGGSASVEETERFVQRYLRVQHADLLFADGVILVEGTAERLLVPAWISRDHPALARRYLSVLEVGGSHAHRLLPLLARLGLPTLIIADLDPGELTQASKRAKKAAVDLGAAQRSLNPTLNKLLQSRTVAQLLDLPAEKKVVPLGAVGGPTARVAFQIPEADGGPCASSLEDAVLAANWEWVWPEGATVGPAFAELLDVPAPGLSGVDRMAWLFDQLKKDFPKAELALELVGRMDDTPSGRPVCPRYIREGLEWLQAELDGAAPAAGGAT
ncbi:MAG: AAA family ATPase [Myxococcales bacterium]|nr:AAA family ATPase [Myxococcales bacterium]